MSEEDAKQLVRDAIRSVLGNLSKEREKWWNHN